MKNRRVCLYFYIWLVVVVRELGNDLYFIGWKEILFKKEEEKFKKINI